jgi:hypothetical protein
MSRKESDSPQKCHHYSDTLLALVRRGCPLRAVKAISLQQWKDGYSADSGPSRDDSWTRAIRVPGRRFVPGRSIPVPTTASPEFQQTIAAPYRVPAWDADPKTSAEWKALVDRLADETVVQTRKVRDRLGVTLESTVIDGVKAFVLTPKTVATSNENRLLVNIHGGATSTIPAKPQRSRRR